MNEAYWQNWIFDGSEELELRCPKCGCPKLFFGEDAAKLTDPMYLGEGATCFECGHEFKITENCWEIAQ